MSATIKYLIGLCAIVAVNVGAAGEIAVGDLSHAKFMKAIYADTSAASDIDFDALRSQADSAVRLLLAAQTDNGST